MGKFRAKISPSWFSDTWISLRYSTNGIFWKSLRACERGFGSDWYFMETESFHYSNAGEILKRFDSIEKIKEFEAMEQAEVDRHNDAETKKRKEDKAAKKVIYDKYS